MCEKLNFNLRVTYYNVCKLCFFFIKPLIEYYSFHKFPLQNVFKVRLNNSYKQCVFVFPDVIFEATIPINWTK